jgi:hypothetical protein
VKHIRAPCISALRAGTPQSRGSGCCQNQVWARWPILVLTMLQKYEITFNHRPSLPNLEEPPGLWASAARALTLGQLGVGLVLRLCVWERQGGGQHGPSVCWWARIRCPDLVHEVPPGVHTIKTLGRAPDCVDRWASGLQLCGGWVLFWLLCWWVCGFSWCCVRARRLALDSCMVCLMTACESDCALLAVGAN